MSDLISRQAAIDAFEEHLDYLQTLNKDENPTAESKWYGVNWARNTIADLPSAQPEDICSECDAWNVYKNYAQPQDIARDIATIIENEKDMRVVLKNAEPQWIPVSERLPKDIRPVIVTWCNTDPKSYYQYIVGKRFIGVAHYKSGKWYWYSSTTEDFLAEYGRYDGEEFDEAIEVLAWCELPEPWNGGEEE